MLNLDGGIYEWIYPLEGQRAQVSYGDMHSNVYKLLFVDKGIMPECTKTVLVKENVGL